MKYFIYDSLFFGFSLVVIILLQYFGYFNIICYIVAYFLGALSIFLDRYFFKE